MARKAMQRRRGAELIVNTSNTDKSNPKRFMLGIPLTGLVRAEWAMARYGQGLPTNWSMCEMGAWLDQVSPLAFTVPNARNIIVQKFIEQGFEWLFFLDHDVLLPPNTLVKLNTYMNSAQYPIVNGLYFTKSKPSEPLIYRGKGTSYFSAWKLGEKVMADGTGLGCTLLHRSILKKIHDESEEYELGNIKVRRVFRNPLEHTYDEKSNAWALASGTEDLDFYNRLQTQGIYKKAGWSKFEKMKYPLLIDTSIFCRHISNDGVQFPAAGEEYLFMSDDNLRAEIESINKHGIAKHKVMTRRV